MAHELLPADRIRTRSEVAPTVDRVTRKSGPWFIDVESPDFFSLHRVRERIAERQSKYQLIQLVELEESGKVLLLDGRVQLTEADEHIYHEMMVHPAMAWGEYANVLVLGGGDGCTLRELLKWKSVKRIVQVELDEAVTELCRKHCPEWHGGAFDDERVELRFEDALNVLEEPELFDFIIADLTEPYDDSGVAGNLSSDLFSVSFYNAVKEKLNPAGMLVVQTGGFRLGRSNMDPHHIELIKNVKEAFGSIRIAYEFIPSFHAFWTATFAAPNEFKNGSPLQDMWWLLDDGVWDGINRRLERHGVHTAYYDGTTHVRLFTSPVDPATFYGWPKETDRRGCCW